MDDARDVRLSADERARQASVHSGSSPVRLRRLWIGLVLAPSVWVLGELVGYYFSSRSCELGRGGIPLQGTPYPSVTHVILEVVAGLIAAFGIYVAVDSWRATLGHDESHQPPALGRSHFMAFTGIVGSSIFLFGIVLFAFSGFVVNACSQAR